MRRIYCTLVISVIMVLAFFAFFVPSQALAQQEDGRESTAVHKREPVSILKLERNPMALLPGLRLRFETLPVNRAESSAPDEVYSVVIRETWTGGVSFWQRTETNRVISSQGVQALSSLDVCESLDPWWNTGESVSEFCHLWLPRRVYDELLVNGKSFFAIDTLVRRDSSAVLLKRASQGHVLVRVNGTLIPVPAIEITSARDTLWILDDPDHPLVIYIASTNFSWELKEVWSPGYTPDVFDRN